MEPHLVPPSVLTGSLFLSPLLTWPWLTFRWSPQAESWNRFQASTMMQTSFSMQEINWCMSVKKIRSAHKIFHPSIKMLFIGYCKKKNHRNNFYIKLFQSIYLDFYKKSTFKLCEKQLSQAPIIFLHIVSNVEGLWILNVVTSQFLIGASDP